MRAYPLGLGILGMNTHDFRRECNKQLTLTFKLDAMHACGRMASRGNSDDASGRISKRSCAESLLQAQRCEAPD